MNRIDDYVFLKDMDLSVSCENLLGLQPSIETSGRDHGQRGVEFWKGVGDLVKIVDKKHEQMVLVASLCNAHNSPIQNTTHLSVSLPPPIPLDKKVCSFVEGVLK